MADQIRIAIMDAVPGIYWKDDEGISDSKKFYDLLAPLNSAAKIDTFIATIGDLPASLDDYDAFLITGSPSSVHDDDEWIIKLSELVIAADSKNKRIIGSCFGHQLIAKTFGGSVGHNEQGWMIGNYQLDITREYDWMQPPAHSTGLYHFNQERVTQLPQAAVSFVDSENYPDFGFTLGDNIMCLQGHPEQPLRAMNNFLNCMTSISEPERKRAREKIDDGIPDSNLWAQWMMRFFET